MQLRNINHTYYIKDEDTATKIKLQVLDYENQPFDLKSAEKVEVIIGINEGRLLTKEPALLDETGVLEFRIDEDDVLVVGKNFVEVHITTIDGRLQKAPSKGYYELILSRSIDTLGANVTKVTLQYFLDEVEKTKQDLTDEVENAIGYVDAKISQMQSDVQDAVQYTSETVNQVKQEFNEQLDTTVSNKMTPFVDEVRAQLAQKANVSEVRKKTIPISLNDVDSEMLAAIEGGEGTSFNLLSIPRDFSVTPRKTTFFIKTKNLFEGKYHNINLRRTGGSGKYTYLMSKPNPSAPERTAIIEIDPNTTYTVKIHEKDKSDTLRIAAHSKLPNEEDYNVNDEYILDTYITYQGPTGLTEFTFTSGANDKFLFVQVSTDGKEPKMQVEKGSVSTPYEMPYYLDSDYIKDLPSPPDPTPVSKSIYEELRGNIYQRDYRVDKLFKSGEGVVSLGDVTLTDVNDTQYLKNNTSAVKMTVNSPVNVRLDFPLNTPIDLYNRTFALYFYLPPETSKTPRQAKFSVFAVYLTTPDGTFIVYPESGNRRFPGWNAIIGNTFNATDASVSGQSLENVTNIRIHLNVDSTVTEPYDIYLDSLASWKEIRKPTVLLEFDDAFHTVYENAFPLMAERGMRGATHVITKHISQPDPSYTSNHGLIRMHDVGWDICSHTVNHPYLSEIPLEEAKFELEQSQKDLLNLGIKNGPQFFIAPYGDSTLDVVDHARKFYSNYRMTGYRRGQPVMPVLPYAMETINAGSRGLNGVTALIDRAAEHGGHLPLMWHGEIGETWGGILWQVGEFRDMLDYLIEKGFDVVTYSDMFPNTRIR